MRRPAGERGVVMVEFLIAIVPVLLVFLGAVQLLLLGVARIVVNHATVAAARSAAVVLDDDPATYGGEPRGHLDTPGESARSPATAAAAPAVNTMPALAILSGPATRMDVIRRAANAPLAAFAPSPAEFARWFAAPGEGDVAEAIGGPALMRVLSGFALYDRAALALRIELPAEAGASDLVTAHVTYLAHCAIPLVSALMCESVPALLKEHPWARRALELVPAPKLIAALELTDERFVVLAAVASFPRQRASYWGANGG